MLTTIKLLVFMEMLLVIAGFVFVRSVKADSRGILPWGYWTVMLAMPVVGIFGHNVNVMYVFAFLIPLFAASSRRSLVCMYLLMLPLFPGLAGNLVLGGVFVGDISTWKAFNLGAVVALMIVPGKPSPSPISIDWAVWILFFITLLLYSRGVPVGGVVRVVITAFLSVIPPYYVVARCMKTRREAEDGALFFVLGGLTNAVVAVFEAKRHWPLFESFHGTLNSPQGLSASLSMRGGFMRAQGVLNNNTVVAVLLALSLIVCVALRKRFSRTGYVTIIAIISTGLLAAQSRGSWIAAAAGLAAYWLYERKLGRVVALAFLGALSWLLILALPKEGRVGQIVGRAGSGQMTADYRSQLLTRGVQEVTKHPLTGQTREQLEVSMNDLRQGENIIDFVNSHLHVALIGGLGGLGLWLFAWYIVCMKVLQARPRSRTLDLTPGVAFGLISASFVALAFTSTIDRMLPFTAIAFGLGAALIAVGKLPASAVQRRTARSARRLHTQPLAWGASPGTILSDGPPVSHPSRG